MAMKPREFAIGDIHGNARGLRQVLGQANFDKRVDTLITVGDVVDGLSDVYDAIEELLTIERRIDVRGNHDDWFWIWLRTGIHPDDWEQGGFATLKSYANYLKLDKLVEPDGKGGYTMLLNPGDIPASHFRFFGHQLPYYKDEKDRLFVHGGFYRWQTLKDNRTKNPSVFWWDRELTKDALSCHNGEKLSYTEPFSEIYVGHTKTLYWKTDKPIHADIVWNIDTGSSSKKGRLTMIDINSKEIYQSDPTEMLYGNHENFRP